MERLWLASSRTKAARALPRAAGGRALLRAAAAALLRRCTAAPPLHQHRHTTHTTSAAPKLGVATAGTDSMSSRAGAGALVGSIAATPSGRAATAAMAAATAAAGSQQLLPPQTDRSGGTAAQRAAADK